MTGRPTEQPTGGRRMEWNWPNRANVVHDYFLHADGAHAHVSIHLPENVFGSTPELVVPTAAARYCQKRKQQSSPSIPVTLCSPLQHVKLAKKVQQQVSSVERCSARRVWRRVTEYSGLWYGTFVGRSTHGRAFTLGALPEQRRLVRTSHEVVRRFQVGRAR
jgi:hypothetical protein